MFQDAVGILIRYLSTGSIYWRLYLIDENSNSISCPLDSNDDMKLKLKMWANQFIDFGLQL